MNSQEKGNINKADGMLRATEVQGPAITAAAFGDRVFVPGQIFTFGDTWDTAGLATIRFFVADEGQAQNHFHLDRIQLVWLRGSP
jgi:hypothetical protein